MLFYFSGVPGYPGFRHSYVGYLHVHAFSSILIKDAIFKLVRTTLQIDCSLLSMRRCCSHVSSSPENANGSSTFDPSSTITFPVSPARMTLIGLPVRFSNS